MESLRKYLGYIVYGLFLFACVFGVISKFTDAADAFKGISDFDSFMSFIATWLTELIVWTIAFIMAIVAMTKLSRMTPEQQDGKAVTFVLLGALAEFIGLSVLLIVYAKLNTVDVLKGDTFWFPWIASLLVVIGVIVRKASLSKNVLASKICGAALALIMMVVAILLMGQQGDMKKVTWIFFIIAYAALCAFPLLSSPLKK